MAITSIPILKGEPPTYLKQNEFEINLIVPNPLNTRVLCLLDWKWKKDHYLDFTGNELTSNMNTVSFLECQEIDSSDKDPKTYTGKDTTVENKKQRICERLRMKRTFSVKNIRHSISKETEGIILYWCDGGPKVTWEMCVGITVNIRT